MRALLAYNPFQRLEKHTWDNVPRIHRIFIFNETKSVHQLDLCDFAGAMGAEILFDILFSH